jgi:hypothetical protein
MICVNKMLYNQWECHWESERTGLEWEKNEFQITGRISEHGKGNDMMNSSKKLPKPCIQIQWFQFQLELTTFEEIKFMWYYMMNIYTFSTNKMHLCKIELTS